VLGGWGGGGSCAGLGESGNPTNMTCRKLDNTKTTDPLDPNGFCLDDTSSAPGSTSDAGSPDTMADLSATDSAKRDVLGTPLDVGLDSDAAADAGTPSAGDDGCSCRAGNRSGRHTGGLLLVLLLLGLVTRRR
jgi:MYXO-CTERM domain-containing protein